MAKEIKYGTEARTALGAGVDKLANTRTERKKRRTRQVLRSTTYHQRWCDDRKGDRA